MVSLFNKDKLLAILEVATEHYLRIHFKHNLVAQQCKLNCIIVTGLSYWYQSIYKTCN